MLSASCLQWNPLALAPSGPRAGDKVYWLAPVIQRVSHSLPVCGEGQPANDSSWRAQSGDRDVCYWSPLVPILTLLASLVEGIGARLLWEAVAFGAHRPKCHLGDVEELLAGLHRRVPAQLSVAGIPQHPCSLGSQSNLLFGCQCKTLYFLP
jgi:hypothetical protein